MRVLKMRERCEVRKAATGLSVKRGKRLERKRNTKHSDPQWSRLWLRNEGARP